MRLLLLLCAAAALASAAHHHPNHAATALPLHDAADPHPCPPPDLTDADALAKKKGFFHVSCDGDTTGFGGGAASSEAARLLAEHAVADANSTDADDASGKRRWGGVVKRVCHGTLKLAWECPSHRAAACAECKGTHVWVKAPCGATVAVCDGLSHHFAKMTLNGGDANGATKLYVGAGALGLSSVVHAPAAHARRRGEMEEAAEEGDDVAGSACKLGKRHTLAHWSHNGVSGKVVTHKKPDWHHGGAAAANAADALAGEARAAFGDSGLALMPPGSPVGAAAVGDAATDASATNSSSPWNGGGDFECNGRASSVLVPCVGASSFHLPSDGHHADMTVGCDGAYSGALGFGCAGLHTARLDYGGKGKGSLRVFKQCSGKSGAHFVPSKLGMATWCRGRASGAALAKCGGKKAYAEDAVVLPK